MTIVYPSPSSEAINYNRHASTWWLSHILTLLETRMWRAVSKACTGHAPRIAPAIGDGARGDLVAPIVLWRRADEPDHHRYSLGAALTLTAYGMKMAFGARPHSSLSSPSVAHGWATRASNAASRSKGSRSCTSSSRTT
ncbi:Epimerase domain-containing protein [Psidium guajava]|nr:Epimerase domain-containing protein [Psidium guajava]